MKELSRWVMWKAEACEMPSWWRKLMTVTEVEDCEKLAQEVWALFWLPKRASKLHKVKPHFGLIGQGKQIWNQEEPEEQT